MEWYWALCLLIGLTIGLMFLGIPVALAFFGANMVGAVIFFGGEAGLTQVARNVVEALVKFSLAPITMFVLMGNLMFHTGVAVRAIDAIEKLIARVPGRLSIITVLGGTVFSTLSGSTMANTALLGSTLLPEMERRGYHRNMALGPILGTGGIAMLIPPSGLAILLGSLSGISITSILITAAIPGVIMAAVHLSYIITRCWLNPNLAPAYDIPQISLAERLKPFIVYVVPLFSLLFLILGSIFLGIATPSESAALGALGALVAASAYRSLTWASLMTALKETGKTAVMIFFIIGASQTFSQILSFSGATKGLLSMMSSINPTPLLLVSSMMLVVLFLGCFVDPLSIMLIVLPFFMPLAESAHLHLVWFGVLMLLNLEIGQTTPPFGLLLFTMKGVAPPDVTMRQIYVAVAPFIILEIGILTALILFPNIVIWLPNLIGR